ncbi:hypothetical protein [Actinosynnema sp. NPDC023587]|uniref:hypothetical protein n=1 Tax=Actinosynnema sp. NPDC023587 TaxID=3154695 RepID=UPI0033EE9E6C
MSAALVDTTAGRYDHMRLTAVPVAAVLVAPRAAPASARPAPGSTPPTPGFDVPIGVLRLRIAQLTEKSTAPDSPLRQDGPAIRGHVLGATARLLDLRLLPTEALGLPNLPSALAQVSLVSRSSARLPRLAGWCAHRYRRLPAAVGTPPRPRTSGDWRTPTPPTGPSRSSGRARRSGSPEWSRWRRCRSAGGAPEPAARG